MKDMLLGYLLSDWDAIHSILQVAFWWDEGLCDGQPCMAEIVCTYLRLVMYTYMY